MRKYEASHGSNQQGHQKYMMTHRIKEKPQPIKALKFLLCLILTYGDDSIYNTLERDVEIWRTAV